MDLTDVIADFSSTYTVTRHGDGSTTFNMGRSVTNTTQDTTLSILACVQPASGRDLQRLPEGERTEETLALWSPVLLYVGTATRAPDEISIDGDSWKVVNVQRWNTLGAYWRVLIQKIGN